MPKLMQSVVVGEREFGTVVAVLKRLAPNNHMARTRLTTSAYDKGFFSAVFDQGDSDANPYEQKAQPNFARGDNNPIPAWDYGRSDGRRVRDMLTGKAVYNITHAEMGTLPRDLQEAQVRQLAK